MSWPRRQSMIALGLLLFLWLAGSHSARAQTVGFSTVAFTSPDHATVLSSGVNAITSYQAYLFSAVADVTSAVPLQTGVVVPRATAVQAGTFNNLPSYTLTAQQTGIVVPPCSVPQAQCPTYTILVMTLGPNGSPARAVASESGPFSLASVAAPPAPAGNVRVQ